jgi:hypothetical protein
MPSLKKRMPSNTVVKNRDTSKWVWDKNRDTSKWVWDKNRDTSKWVWDKNRMLIKMGAK